MKKVIAYTDGVNVYVKDDTTSVMLGCNQPELEEYKESVLEASTIVELTKAGLSIDDMAKLRREGLL